MDSLPGCRNRKGKDNYLFGKINRKIDKFSLSDYIFLTIFPDFMNKIEANDLILVFHPFSLNLKDVEI